MAEFKCISCGAVKESDSTCTCPTCGYRMFEAPYDRGDKLKNEIKGFISSLAIARVERDDFVFQGKDKDDKRFPDYDKILKYVTERDRTEDFMENLLETINELRLHYTANFSKTYPVSFEKLNEKLVDYDEVLLSAVSIINPVCHLVLEPIKWEDVKARYSENQDRYLWYFASELLDYIEKLSQKVVRFIKINNLYGDSHKYYPERRKKKFEGELDYKEQLEYAISETKRIISKEYIIDITDDGVDELKEMLTCLWHDIELIMHAPLFVKTYEYVMDSERLTEEEMDERISFKLGKRYSKLNDTLDLRETLDGKTEDEIFEIYKSLIAIDKFGFLIPTGTEVINIGESEKNLNTLIGLSDIKESIKKIKAYALSNKDSKDLNLHMCFLGNPGSGKTEVARYVAGILYENKILPTKNVIEVDRSGLVSQYFGATAEKTKDVIDRAMGGVLFIDEAYALGNNSDKGITDYGKEAIDTLVKAMEDHRGDFCVIFAGYRNEMNKMLSVNPGLKSRIQFMLDFPNYSRDELKSITELMLRKRGYTMGDLAMNRILDITDIRRKDPNFANAREIRNILDQVIMCQNLRVAGLDDKELGIIDVKKYIDDANINLPKTSESITSKVLTGEEELESLIGLDNVKRMVKKIKAYAKRNKEEADFNLHMCFYGNPGTGKTEVARIISRILYDAGVLGEAKLVETDGQGLLGKFVGETAPKTLEKINEAMDGVLFIDEAYSLVNSGVKGYGEEAISVLLKEMEDRRGKFCVILAGYKDEMKNLLSANPGFESRIQFKLDFPDYTRDELKEIGKSFLLKKKYDIDDSAMEKVLDVAEYYRKRPDFANARTIRNILDQVILNQNLRTEDEPDNNIVIDDVNDYIMDEGIDLDSAPRDTRKIGFI